MIREAERSRGAIAMLAISVALLGTAFALTWFEYDFSSGRQTSPDGPYQDEVVVERSAIDYYPFRTEGDSPPEEGAAFQLGLFASVAGALLLLPTIAELPRRPWISRRVSLWVSGAGLLGTTATLAFVWFAIPAELSSLGVDGAYTHVLIEPDGYTRTGLGVGWVLAATSLASTAAALLIKFQAGSYDESMVEAYRA